VGTSVVAACADGSVRVFDVPSGTVRKVSVANFRLKVVRSLPNAARPTVLVGGDSGDLLIVDVASGDLVSRFTNGSACVRDVLVDHVGGTVFTGDDDGRVRAWTRSENDFRPAGEASHSHRVWCLAVDETSSRLFSAGNDAVIRVWDAKSLKQLDLYEGH